MVDVNPDAVAGCGNHATLAMNRNESLSCGILHMSTLYLNHITLQQFGMGPWQAPMGRSQTGKGSEAQPARQQVLPGGQHHFISGTHETQATSSSVGHSGGS